MKLTGIEISLEWENSGEYEHESYFDSIDVAIRYLKKLKKEMKEENMEDKWE